MSNVAHTVGELVAAVGTSYRAIDIRSVAIRKEDSWVNAMGVIRLTYEDVSTAKVRLVRLAQRFPAVRTEALRIDSFVRHIEDFALARLRNDWQLCDSSTSRLSRKPGASRRRPTRKKHFTFLRSSAGKKSRDSSTQL